MSPRSALLLVLGFALSLGAWWALRTSPRSADAPDASALVPGRISEIRRIDSENAERAVGVVRSQPGVGWLVIERTGETSTAWPADRDRVGAGLRILGASRSTPAARSVELDRSTLVRIATDGNGVSLEIGSDALGGERFARLERSSQDASPVRIADDLAGMLEPGSLITWRDTSVFPLLDDGVQRIAITGAAGRTELRRVGSRWGTVSPVAAAADGHAVRRLLDLLASLRFGASPGSDEGDLDEQGVSIEVAGRLAGREILWRAVISPDGRATASIKGLLEDGSAEVLRASGALLNRPDLTPLVRVERLLARSVLDLPASEIAAVRLTRADGSAIAVARTGRTWSGHADVAEALLAVLCASEADAVELRSGSVAGAQGPAATIELDRFGGLPVGAFECRLEGDTLSVLSEHVAWRFDLSEAPPESPEELVAAYLAAPTR
ncbi:MAG: DUF4340 domain-containing protein [Phycisphaerales bacterium]